MGQLGRFVCGSSLANQGELGVCANWLFVESCEHFVTDLEPRYRCTDRDHYSGQIVSQHERKPIRNDLLERAVANLEINRIDARRLDSNQKVVRRWFRLGYFFDLDSIIF